MRCAALSIVTLLLATTAHARKWTDASGNYSVEATLVAHNDKTVVLQKESKDLISVHWTQLSKADQAYLATLEDAKVPTQDNKELQVWEMEGGWKVHGNVVGYANREFVIEQTGRDITVNKKKFSELPAILQTVVLRVVALKTDSKITDAEAFGLWVGQQQGVARKFETQGVLMRLENDELVPVPFFLFSEEDLKLLKTGYKNWVAMRKDEVPTLPKTNTPVVDPKPDQTPKVELDPDDFDGKYDDREEDLYLEAMARAYYKDRSDMRRIQRLQLQLQAYEAGLFDLWEVAIYPRNARPVVVVVPGEDSRQARVNAAKRYPGARIGAIAKVRN